MTRQRPGRIILIHRYFWPDSTPYAHILRRIALALGEAGHEVRVFTCQPSYRPPAGRRAPARERLSDRVTVHRWPVLPDRRLGIAKVINLVSFSLWLLAKGLRLGRADVVMAASTPPVVVARVAAWIARRCRARFFYHKQDIYPDVLVAAGLLRHDRLATLLRRADAATERRADRVVVLSRDMATTVRRRGVTADRIAVLNNFDPWDADPDTTTVGRPDRVEGEPLRVAVAGSLGRFQNLEIVLAAVALLRDDPAVEWHFFGDGPLRELVQRQVEAPGQAVMRAYGHRPPPEVARFLRERADVGIVSLLPGMINAAYPSRTMSYLRHGCPVLALVDPGSELADMLESSGAGLQVDPTSAEELATAVRDLAGWPAELTGARKYAEDLYHTRFEPSRQLERWVALMQGSGS